VESARTTTTSCWYVARTIAIAVILSGVLTQAFSRQEAPVAGIPGQLPGTPVPLPEAPTAIAWTVPIPAAPIASPVLAGELVLVAHLPGIVAAYRQNDGHELWRVDLNPHQPPATDGTLLFVAAGEAIHALRLTDGSEAWRVQAGTLTAPLLVKDGWIIVASRGKLTARRATDGSTVWSVEAGMQRAAGAISGDILYVPLVEGRVVARDLTNGQVKWERRFGGSPGDLLVVGDEIFFGAGDKQFYCLDALSGEVAWKKRVGAEIRGRASTDGERIFFTALDHLVRAIDRGNGAERWHKGVPFRPMTGPVTSGGAVFVAGPEAEIRVLLAKEGTSAGGITFPARLALSPGLLETDAGIVFAAVTGGLEESWKLSVTHPIRRGTRPR
jgi:outer membrane protein assembly factor BamB